MGSGRHNPLSEIKLRVASWDFVLLLVKCLLGGAARRGGRRADPLFETGRTSCHVYVERSIYMRTVISSILISCGSSSDFRPPHWLGRAFEWHWRSATAHLLERDHFLVWVAPMQAMVRESIGESRRFYWLAGAASLCSLIRPTCTLRLIGGGRRISVGLVAVDDLPVRAGDDFESAPVCWSEEVRGPSQLLAQDTPTLVI